MSFPSVRSGRQTEFDPVFERRAPTPFYCRLSDRAVIEQLARLVGIEAHYTDIFGRCPTRLC